MGLIKVQITIFMGVIFYRDVQQLTDTLKPVRNMSNTALMLLFFFFFPLNLVMCKTFIPSSTLYLWALLLPRYLLLTS